ncbi:MAG: transposase [Chloroflexi bacterium]|nr:transposase [Chloroflexota bacterium]
MSTVDSNVTSDPREAKGQRIAGRARITRNGTVWIVPSETSDAKYTVDLEAGTCTYPDFETGHVHCKHQFAVEYTITRETDSKGNETVTKTVRMTYSQRSPAYNAAQTHEQEHFEQLLRELCDGISQPPHTFGRPRLPLADVVFALGEKTYSTLSGRRATSYIRNAESRGFLDHSPHYNSAFRYLESADLMRTLKDPIEESAKPLKAIEVDFAIDSTGFATRTYQRWFDVMWGKERTRQTWVKTHIITGVLTNIVTSVEATPTESGDAPQLPVLVNATARNFAIREVSADKAYASRANHHAIATVGASAYIPMQDRHTGQGHAVHSIWQRAWHFYNFNREGFSAHYHKRSNIESTMAMIKAKFGASVRAKTPVAQVNEVLLKVLCHNIVVLVQSIYELDLEPVFWTFEAERPVAPNLSQRSLF